jgi:ABC-type uncharacterized transport system substrate-binding protein
MQFGQLMRREFITLLGIVAAAWPFAVRAQQRSDKMRQIGILMGFAQDDPVAQSMVAAFRGALSKLGWIEGSNVRIELRWAGPDSERISSLAKELAGLRPDVILGQTTPVVRALAREVPTTPIVFVTVSDPIGSGFAASLAHPGGNITGFMVDDSALGGKWVELAQADGASHDPRGAAVQSGRPATRILLAVDTSRCVLLKRPGEPSYNSWEG